jgi:uncharacterized protein (DUF362 family)
MKRRQFVKRGLKAGFLTGMAGLAIPNINLLYGKNGNSRFAGPYDLVAVKGGMPGQMFTKAIESLGGMKAYVKKGQKVVVKPNIAWDTPPERAANTNPELVAEIVKQCLAAGAKEVYVFDHTMDNWTKSYRSSGIDKYVKEAGGKMVSGNSESYFQDVTLTGTQKLKNVKVHELILESDVFINVPVLKHHSSTKLSLAMKNLMGSIWDRRYWHRNDLHRCIAEFPTYKKPNLNIVDGNAILKRNGPRGVSTSDVLISKSLLVSGDLVAIDAAAAKIFGMDPASIPYIKYADAEGLGTMDLSKLNINRIKI